MMRFASFAAMWHSSPKASASYPFHQARKRPRKKAGGNSGEEDEMNKREWLEELKANPKKIRFARICKIAEAFGFQTRQGPGSHRIYYKDGVREILNIQNEDGWAKPYQVRQFIKIIEKYDLQED